MSEQRGRYLYVMRGGQTAKKAAPAETESGPPTSDGNGRQPDAPTGTESAVGQDALSRAIMHAAVGWAAVCASGEVREVNIQPVGKQVYEAALAFTDGRSLMVRVRFIVWAGQSVRTVVEPVVP